MISSVSILYLDLKGSCFRTIFHSFSEGSLTKVGKSRLIQGKPDVF